MAWPNIDERREYVKRFVIDNHMKLHYSVAELQVIGDQFGCSHSAIRSDIQRIFSGKKPSYVLRKRKSGVRLEIPDDICKDAFMAWVAKFKAWAQTRSDIWPTIGECWPCSGRPNLYGGFAWNGRVYRAHRVSYSLFVGHVPISLEVGHACDVPGCCNPNHLFLCDRSTNMLDSVKKNRHRWAKKYDEPTTDKKGLWDDEPV